MLYDFIRIIYNIICMIRVDRKMPREVFGQLLRAAQPTSGKGNPLGILRSCGLAGAAPH